MPYGVPQRTSDYLRSSSGSLAMFAPAGLACVMSSR